MHPFLSPAWIAAVRDIRDEYRGRVNATAVTVRANVTITEAPFDEPRILGHIDTSSGALTIDEGHLSDQDFGIELTYAVAYQIFVDRDPQAVMSVLIGGQVKLSGDSSKLMLLAGAAAPPQAGSDTESLAREIIRRIDEITAPAP